MGLVPIDQLVDFVQHNDYRSLTPHLELRNQSIQMQRSKIFRQIHEPRFSREFGEVCPRSDGLTIAEECLKVSLLKLLSDTPYEGCLANPSASENSYTICRKRMVDCCCLALPTIKHSRRCRVSENE